MKLIDFFSGNEIDLHLRASEKETALREMVELLDLDGDAEDILHRLLMKRENLGSTGIGKGVAIPHCRSLVVDRLRIAYGRKPEGISFDAVDSKAVYHFFLIVAPPVEISNQYLPVLGKIAQFCKNPNNLQRLSEVASADEFLKAIERSEP